MVTSFRLFDWHTALWASLHATVLTSNPLINQSLVAPRIASQKRRVLAGHTAVLIFVACGTNNSKASRTLNRRRVGSAHGHCAVDLFAIWRATKLDFLGVVCYVGEKHSFEQSRQGGLREEPFNEWDRYWRITMRFVTDADQGKLV